MSWLANKVLRGSLLLAPLGRSRASNFVLERSFTAAAKTVFNTAPVPNNLSKFNARNILHSRKVLAPFLVSHTIDNAVNNTEKNLENEVPPVFAVVAIGGSQFKVGINDEIVVNKLDLEFAPVGKLIDLDDVLLVGSRESTVVGRPLIPDAKVRVLVREQSKDAKVIVYKRRRRKHSERWNGFRRQITLLCVKDIIYDKVPGLTAITSTMLKNDALSN